MDKQKILIPNMILINKNLNFFSKFFMVFLTFKMNSSFQIKIYQNITLYRLIC